MRTLIISTLLLLSALSYSIPTFVRNPAMTADGNGSYTITFELSENSDVEVSIVDTRDSSVVRHLVAGVLGTNPPPPLTANSLSQTLKWDGTDDFKKAVLEPNMLSVRVRAGMVPRLNGFAGENLYGGSGTLTTVTDPANGNVYVLDNGATNYGKQPFLRKYDSKGNYLKTLYPPPANLPADSVKSYGINITADGKWVPKSYYVNGNGLHFGRMVYEGATIFGFTADKKIRINSPKSGFHNIDTNGCFTDTAYNAIRYKTLAVSADTNPPMFKTQASFNSAPYIFERVAVNRKNDCVFWNGGRGSSGVYLSDWKNPVIRPLPEELDNITIGPDGRFLYAWSIIGQSVYGNAFIKRYSASTFAAAPYGTSGSNKATGQIAYEWGWAGTPGNHRGIAVGWQNQIAAFTEEDYLFQVKDTGGTLSSIGRDGPLVGDCRKLVTSELSILGAYAREGMMSVKFDPAGNYYVGLRKLQSPIVPSGFASDASFKNIGSVVKFHPDSVGTYNPVTRILSGHTKIYPQPFGPFTQFFNGSDPLNLGDPACTCRNSYFDVDPYGRIYVPNGVTCQVYVADNAGTNIAVFGSYGNSDSRGGLAGPGELIAEPAIPLSWPTSVAASEDFIYIGDRINARLVRVQMDYTLDNLPGLTGGPIHVEKSGVNSKFALSAYPNPLNATTKISISGVTPGSHSSVKIFDLSGKLVTDLSSKMMRSGTNNLTLSWNATGLPSGVYFLKAYFGKQILTKRLIYQR
ncbi:MAG: T9SS type A sorting domain-containing protein [Fibrobacteres bacterium]|nr:T9SS type A sorting domain-containing protein [Fibrobacterota bacterium]